jgi:hypothetical protein
MTASIPIHAHEEIGSAHTASASVTLDIGAGRGALVIYPAESYRGREIEISRLGGIGQRVHTGVHERRSASGEMLTAIFGSLPAGEYVLWADADRQAGSVTVPDGSVVEVSLP